MREAELVELAVGRAAPIDGGALAVVGLGVVDREAGFSLSHVEKKSSVSLTGVDEASGVNSKPSMWIPWGYLQWLNDNRALIPGHTRTFVHRSLLDGRVLPGTTPLDEKCIELVHPSEREGAMIDHRVW